MLSIDQTFSDKYTDILGGEEDASYSVLVVLSEDVYEIRPRELYGASYVEA